MSEHNTPEARAEKAYPMDHYTHQVQREAYAAALRDDAARDERTSENAKLRALVQVLVDRHGEVKWDAECCDWSCERCGNDYGMKETDLYDSTEQALSAAKEQGFAPTNTEDNG